MYTYKPFYDHYVILKNGETLYHIDNEAEAKKEIELLNGGEKKTYTNLQSDKYNYTCYHLHTEQSLLDSCTNYKLYIDKAVELGQKAICFTEHGNVYQNIDKKMYCDEKGIKYLHGVECYLTETHDKKIRDNYHTILVAKNFDGVKEINKLVFLSTHKDHTYYKPRLSFGEFLNISDNIIKISACLASPLNRYIRLNQNRDNIIADKLMKHYDYYEIQYHDYQEQIEFNQWLLKMSKRYNKPLIVGTDTHSLNPYKAECRTILQLGKGIEFDNEDEFDLSYKSYDELCDIFERQNSIPKEEWLQAIKNTNIMADSVQDYTLDTTIKYPLLYDNDTDVIKKRINSMYKEKVSNNIIKANPKYVENIKEEMRVFEKVNMVGFMLFMSELMCWCRDNNIPFSYGRGCFTNTALIQTKGTLKTINKVKVGDFVIADDGKWHEVTNTMQYYINEPLVEFQHQKQGSIYKKYKNQCTLDHKILVNRNNKNIYIQAKELKLGDLLCSPKIKHTYKDFNNIIDLNEYNTFGFEYDDNYIYEKVRTNKEYKYSSKWFEKNTTISSAFVKRIINGYMPTTQKGLEYITIILEETKFNSIEDYIKYAHKHMYKVTKIKRFIKFNHLTSLFIGMMYGDGWTQKDCAIGIAVNKTTKNKFNKKAFYLMANKLGLTVTANPSSTKNLEQLYINSFVINNWFKTDYFVSKKGANKTFNSKLFDMPIANLKWLYIGLLKTDGSSDKKNNKICFDNTSLSLVNAYNILDNIVNKIMPNSLDVRLEHKDTKRGYINKESYKTRRGFKSKRSELLQDNNYWYLPITKINIIDKKPTMVYDFTVKDCHSYTINNIIVHNSVAGSTTAYISGITDVDPVIMNTVFSRFCNEDRLEVGDIDCDFYEEDRPKVYNYIINRFGKDKTAYIMASGTVVDKGTIDLIGRALHTKWLKDNNIKKGDKDKEKNSPYNLSNIKQIKLEYEENAERTRTNYKDIFYYFDGIVNTVITQSQHPAGIIASPIPLVENYGGFLGVDGQTILSINMEEVHEVGLVKYDILGLATVGIIKKTCEYANIKYPLPTDINLNDKLVYNDIYNTPIGIFQYESKFAHQSLVKYQAKSIEDLSLINATIRPSGESYRERLLNREFNKNPSEIIDKMLEPTLGYLCYQEQTIQFLQDICGLSGSEADNVRRAIGRKQMDRLQKALPEILKGYCDKSTQPRDIAEQEAKTFLQIIEDSSNYQFGKNHSISYSLLGYVCAYLRFYYPKEFICAYLNCAEKEEDINSGQELAKIKKIQISGIKFRKSLNEYFIDKDKPIIYKGLKSIKDIGKNNGSELYTLKDNHYNTFVDLLYDIKNKTTVNSKQLDILIKLDFFSEFGDINELFRQQAIYEQLSKIYTKIETCKQINKDYLKEFDFVDLSYIESISDKSTEKQFKGIDNIKLLKLFKDNENLIIDSFNIPSAQKTTIQQKILYQVQLLGYCDLTIPDISDTIYVIENIKETKYYPLLTLYQLKTGVSKEYRCNNTQFKKNKSNVGDIIDVIFENKEKMKMIEYEGEKFFKGTGILEDRIKMYKRKEI